MDGSLKIGSCYWMTEKRQASVISQEDNLEMILGLLSKQCLIAFRFSDSVLFLENNHNWVDKNYLFWKEWNPLLALPESPETHGSLESSGGKPPLQIQRSAHSFNDFSDVLSIAKNLQRVIRILVNTGAELTALGLIYRSKFVISTDILHSEVLFSIWENNRRFSWGNCYCCCCYYYCLLLVLNFEEWWATVFCSLSRDDLQDLLSISEFTIFTIIIFLKTKSPAA